jgi:hypothetical protein
VGLLDVGARTDRVDLPVLDRQRLGGRLLSFTVTMSPPV